MGSLQRSGFAARVREQREIKNRIFENMKKPSFLPPISSPETGLICSVLHQKIIQKNFKEPLKLLAN